MKTNIITNIRISLLVPIITLIASFPEKSVHADEVKDRHTSLRTKTPETPTRCDHTAALREIDLRVALRQYEKILTELEDTKRQLIVGPKKAGLSEQNIERWRDARKLRVAFLTELYTEYRKNIEFLSVETAPETPTPAVFGPVIERVIMHPADGTENYFLDLDSGNFVAAPEDVFNLLRNRFDEFTKTARTDAPIKNWAQTSGADLSLAFTSPDVTLSLYGGAIVFPTLSFEAADPREALRMADDALRQQKRDGKAMPPLTMFHRYVMDRDGAFVFRTREGGVGLMQIVNSTENPRSVKIRQKLIESGAASTAGRLDEDDIKIEVKYPHGTVLPSDHVFQLNTLDEAVLEFAFDPSLDRRL